MRQATVKLSCADTIFLFFLQPSPFQEKKRSKDVQACNEHFKRVPWNDAVVQKKTGGAGAGVDSAERQFKMGGGRDPRADPRA